VWHPHEAVQERGGCTSKQKNLRFKNKSVFLFKYAIHSACVCVCVCVCVAAFLPKRLKKHIRPLCVCGTNGWSGSSHPSTISIPGGSTNTLTFGGRVGLGFTVRELETALSAGTCISFMGIYLIRVVRSVETRQRMKGTREKSRMTDILSLQYQPGGPIVLKFTLFPIYLILRS
jgi:hypothetical protein